MNKIIVMIGPPGSGKGTQAKLLADNLGYKHISTGDLLRNLEKLPDINQREKEALENMKNGSLVPDWLIYQLAFKEIEESLANGKGVVLDGAIRNREQAKDYYEFIKKLKKEDELVCIYVEISEKESIDRLSKRKVCENCGEIIPFSKVTENLYNCPKCNGNLFTREDDDISIIKERLVRQGNYALQPIADFFENLGMLRRIDGEATIEEVKDQIQTVLSA